MSLKKALLSSSSLRLAEASSSTAFLEKAIENLERLASDIVLETDEILLRQGEEGDRFYVVVKGQIIADDQKTGQTLHTFKEGDRFGERWLLFPHEPAGATCKAGKDGATLKSVTRIAFQREFGSCFAKFGAFRGRIVHAKTSKATRFLERDVCEFRGIEYATRESRYALPRVREYDGQELVDAFEDGPECLQIGGALFDQLVPKAPKRSRPSLLEFHHNKAVSNPNENCLCLNIYAPLGSDGAVSQTKLPIMVWIHGGAFITGSCSLPMYNGRELASKGVVVIGINYRLGALGFIHGVPEVPMNLGLHDQVTALRWVKKHAHMFGGDVNNITVFGESAGGMSVSCLLGMRVRRQEQLFHKAIVQSGNAHAVLSQSQAASVVQQFNVALLSHLKLPRDTKVDKRLLESIPIDAILAATETVTRGMVKADYLRGISMPFQPCCFENGPISYDLLFECVPPLVQVGRGIADDVTMMIGANNNEYSLFMLDNYWRKIMVKNNNSKKAFKNFVKNKLVEWASPEDTRYRVLSELEARAQAIVDYYLPNGASDEISDDEAHALFERVHSAWLFHLGVEAMIMLKSGDGGKRPVYIYRLHLLCPMNQLGSPHALDLPLIFGTFKNDPVAAMLCGDGPESTQCSAEMSKAWISFAKTGNPGWSPDKPKIFGAEPSQTFPEARSSIFLATKERALWDGFVERAELDHRTCKARAFL